MKTHSPCQYTAIEQCHCKTDTTQELWVNLTAVAIHQLLFANAMNLLSSNGPQASQPNLNALTSQLQKQDLSLIHI